MEDVFRRLSIGKETILYKNLLTWDVVHDLLNEGSVDDKSLKQYFADCGEQLRICSYLLFHFCLYSSSSSSSSSAYN